MTIDELRVVVHSWASLITSEWGESQTGDGEEDALIAALDELERLRAENAALREIAGHVATYAWETVAATDEYDVEVPCPWCRRVMSQIHHAPDCPVTRAGALLAA